MCRCTTMLQILGVFTYLDFRWFSFLFLTNIRYIYNNVTQYLVFPGENVHLLSKKKPK